MTYHGLVKIHVVNIIYLTMKQHTLIMIEFLHMFMMIIWFDHKYATLKSEIMDTPNLTYKDFVFMIWKDDTVDQMIIALTNTDLLMIT